MAVVGDVDDHALTWTAVAVRDDHVAIVGERTLPQLGLRAWRSRLIDAVAERCVRQTRRDPRDSAAAEQMLFDQLDAACDSCRQGRLVELVIQSDHWFQNLMLRPEECNGFCAPLSRQAAQQMQALDEETSIHDSVRTVLITATRGERGKTDAECRSSTGTSLNRSGRIGRSAKRQRFSFGSYSSGAARPTRCPTAQVTT